MLNKLYASSKVLLAVLFMICATNVTSTATAFAATDENVEVVSQEVEQPVVEPPVTLRSSTPDFQSLSFFNFKVTPTAPTWNDVCGTKNDTYYIPKVNGVLYMIDAGALNLPVASDHTYGTFGANRVRIVALALPPYSFNSNQQTSWTFDYQGDCEVETPTPGVIDPCGPDNAEWEQQSNAYDSTWTEDNGHLVATAKDGYVFDNGKKVMDFGTPTDSNTACDPCAVPDVVALRFVRTTNNSENDCEQPQDDCETPGQGGGDTPTTPETPVTPTTPVTPATPGAVLSAVTTTPTVAPQLANTGETNQTSMFVALSVMFMALILGLVSRKQTK